MRLLYAKQNRLNNVLQRIKATKSHITQGWLLIADRSTWAYESCHLNIIMKQLNLSGCGTTLILHKSHWFWPSEIKSKPSSTNGLTELGILIQQYNSSENWCSCHKCAYRVYSLTISCKQVKHTSECLTYGDVVGQTECNARTSIIYACNALP